MIQEINEACKIVKNLSKLKKIKGYALTGAGISKASNIPTFRGEDGLWEKYNFEEVATLQGWLKNPIKIWTMYKEGIHRILETEPNQAHFALAKLEKKGYIDSIITQNADSLHQRAGSLNVIEVHGNLLRVRCTSCEKKSIFTKAPEVIPPKCSCGSMLRPDVVLYNETLPEKEINFAYKLAKEANLVFIVGTSAEVYPVAALPNLSKRNRAKIIVINPEKTEHAEIADVYILGKSEEMLPKLVDKLLQK